MAGLKSFLERRGLALRWLVCGVVVALFTWNVSLFYLPGQGYTYFIEFGSKEHARYLPELLAVNHFEMRNSPGYDSQWYAQIAMHPRLTDPVIRHAVDSLPYRARRILFEWTAWLMGGGNPTRVMNLYALQNVFCWYLLALLLLRWFPPDSWQNSFRWVATVLSFGLIFSVRSALLDGPCLLIVAVGMALIESGRTWWGALAMGVSGLGKETSIIGGMALSPPDIGKPRTWAPWAGKAVLVVAPIVLWLLYINVRIGKAGDVGARNFAPPFTGLVDKIQDIVSGMIAGGAHDAMIRRLDLMVVVGLLAQFFFFAARIRWRDPWWRVGATYAVLMVVLGGAVWEYYPSAAARVLLPMTLAFNVLVPRKGSWLVLLIAGNLGMFGAADLLKPPGRETFKVVGPSALEINPKDNSVVRVIFGPKNWWDPEKSRWEYFRWTLGDCSLAIRNPQPFPIVADVRFRLRSVDSREAKVTEGGKVLWDGMLAAADIREAVIPDLLLPPGDTTLDFQSDRPPAYPGNDDERRLSFSVRSLEIDLKSRR
ncbi:MAG TPA: hypothetical protein VIJ19_03915 [Opitutaceae bacterium]